MSAGGQVDVETISQSISFVLMLILSKTYDKNHQACFKYHYNTSTWGAIEATQQFGARHFTCRI